MAGRIAAVASEFEWRWGEADLAEFLTAIGWQVREAGPRWARLSASGSADGAGGIASFGRVPSRDSDIRLEYLSFPLVDLTCDDDVRVDELRGRIVARIERELGEREGLSIWGVTECVWSRKLVDIRLAMDDRSIALDLIDPGHVVHADCHVAVPDWAQLSSALPSVLLDLNYDEFLILRTTGGRFAHFSRSGTLNCEVASNLSLSPEFELSAEDERRLIERGWQEPDDIRDWGYEIDVPISADELATVVADVKHALHDVMGVASPAELRIVAGRSDEGPHRCDLRALSNPGRV